MSDDGVLPDEEVVEETKTIKKRSDGAVRPVTHAQITAFAAAIATGGRELNVSRITGPGGKMTYRKNGLEVAVQCEDCPDKLPPEAADHLVQAIKQRWGGGHYRVWPDHAKSHEVLYPIKVPGKPLPLDAAQAADDEADAEKKEAEVQAAKEGYGYEGMFQSPMAPPRPGYYFDPALRQQMPQAPFHSVRTQEIERENQDLRRKVDIDPLQREIADLKKQADRPPGESPFKGIIEMIHLQQTEAQRQRDYQLAVEREERKARELRDGEERTLERERMQARVAEVQDERKIQGERDREDRIERDKDRKAMLDMVLQIALDQGGKRDPIDGVVRMLQVAQGVKDLNNNPKSEAAEIAEAVGATGKDLIGAIGDAFKSRGAPEEAKVVFPTDERLQMIDVLDVMCSLASSTPPLSPRSAFNAVAGFCLGRGIDFAKVCEQLKGYSTPEAVAKLREDLKAKVSLVPPEYKPKLEGASAALENEGRRQWLLEVSTVAVGGVGG